MIKPGEVDWTKVFTGSRHFHVSGITPALSASATQVTVEALNAAKKAGLTVSYDLNYRKKLWSPADAKKIQEPMMADVDILITTEEDTNVVFGIKEKDYEAVAEKLAQTFKLKMVAITLREDLSVWKNNWVNASTPNPAIFDQAPWYSRSPSEDIFSVYMGDTNGDDNNDVISGLTSVSGKTLIWRTQTTGNNRGIPVSQLKVISTTAPIPNDAMVASPSLDPGLAQEIGKVLLGLDVALEFGEKVLGHIMKGHNALPRQKPGGIIMGKM
jgi:hypothetical protein